MGKYKRMNAQDVYYDGLIDNQYEMFCEETQTLCRNRKSINDIGWGILKSDTRYIEEDDWDDVISFKTKTEKKKHR
ncbi:hypothetical protein [Paenibacillus xylaniclasticus]|uniref:hypothetical protein n=1 Tax=Paenibacillus xylaniclasticus TaxID=588083 RepID=UPI000FDB03A7|nr:MULTISPECIES: hypothetical protein [Paenibacillus]GFN32580.1 hypothetical protein PCURB6_28400 [Paenibacillus curdlanolyticus]